MHFQSVSKLLTVLFNGRQGFAVGISESPDKNRLQQLRRRKPSEFDLNVDECSLRDIAQEADLELRSNQEQPTTCGELVGLDTLSCIPEETLVDRWSVDPTIILTGEIEVIDPSQPEALTESEPLLDNQGEFTVGQFGFSDVAQGTACDPAKMLHKPPSAGSPLSGKRSFINFSEDSLIRVAANERTPAGTLSWLATHPNAEIRLAVAANKNALPETIWLLAQDDDDSVRLAIAENPITHKEALRALVCDSNPLVSWRAKQTLSIFENVETRSKPQAKTNFPGGNDKLPAAASLSGHSHNRFIPKSSGLESGTAFLKLIAEKTSTPPSRLSQLADHLSKDIRIAVAGNPNISLDTIWHLARDSEPAVKLKLIDNYNCPLETLHILKDDEDPYVSLRASNVLSRLTGGGGSDIKLEEDSTTRSPRLMLSR